MILLIKQFMRKNYIGVIFLHTNILIISLIRLALQSPKAKKYFELI